MARPKTREDVELARINADRERDRLYYDTTLYCILIVAGVATVGILAWTVVKITDKPPWLQAILSIVPLVGESLIIWRQRIAINKYRELFSSLHLDPDAEGPQTIAGDPVGGHHEP